MGGTIDLFGLAVPSIVFWGIIVVVVLLAAAFVVKGYLDEQKKKGDKGNKKK